MKRHLLNLFLALSIIVLGNLSVTAQVTGDFRTVGTGSWDNVANWQTFDGSSWVAATAKPGAANNVFIQYAHIITLQGNEACKDLNTCVSDGTGTTSGIVKLQSNTLEVNGKLRCYIGSVGTIPGTGGSSALSFGATKWPIQATSNTSGLLKITGDSRALTSTGEWGAGSGTSASYVPSVEVALNPGQTVTINTNIKFSNWNFTSGTFDAQLQTVSADNNTNGVGIITIGPNAVYISNATGNTFQRTGSGMVGTVQVDGLLIFMNAAPKIQSANIILNGTVEYAGSAAQVTLVQTVGTGWTHTYNNLTVNNNSGVSLSAAASVNGTLSFLAGKLTAGNFDLTIGGSGSVTGYETDRYIVTSGTGYLKRSTNGTGTVIYPIGPSAVSYTPFESLNNTSNDVFGVRVKSGITNTSKLDYEKCVKLEWYGTESVPGGNDGTIKFHWYASDNGASFNPSGSVLFGAWNGTGYNTNSVTVVGSDPYSVTMNAPAEYVTSPVIFANQDAFLSDPPVLTADGTANNVDNDIEITFADDATWRGAITSVRIGSDPLTTGTDFNVEAGKIILKPSGGNPLLTASGTKTVTVVATGYMNATVSQAVLTGAISTLNSTVVADTPLALNTTSVITITARDQYNNLIEGYIAQFDVSVTDNDPSTNESYSINSSAYDASASDTNLGATNPSGVFTFGITVPSVVDGNDGVTVQVTTSAGTALGSPLTYSAPPGPVASLSPESVTEHALSGAVITITLQNVTFAATLNKSNYILNNAPEGLTVSSVTRVDDAHASLIMEYPDASYDFDTDISNFSIKIAASELTGGSDLTSGAISVIAMIETVPVVTISSVFSALGETTATWNGSVTSDGGEQVVEKGICWSTTTGPTIAGSKTTEGPGTGAITGTITGLALNTTYYVRAYATNSLGTQYSDEKSFTTLKGEPTAHVSDFATGGTTSASLILTWTGLTGSQIPDAYLILAKTSTGTYTVFEDGDIVADDTDWADGNAAINVAHVTGANSYTFNNLTPNTNYSFEIYPYTSATSGNNFKTDGSVPSLTARTLNNGVSITSFAFNGLTPVAVGTVNSTAHTVTVSVPGGTAITSLVPTIVISEGATIDPASGTARDFTAPVTYTVTAEDPALSQVWTVTVEVVQVMSPVYDSFDYTIGALLSAQTSGNWAALNTTGNTEPVISTGSLSYPMLVPPLGNKVSFDGSGTDIAKSFESQTKPGTIVYFSFIFRVTDMSAVTSTTGAHFAGFVNGTSTYGCGVYVKWDGVAGSNKFYIGTSTRAASSAVPQWSATTYDINKPILIVGAYEIVGTFVSGQKDDKSYLWINPDASTFGNESAPAPMLSSTNAGGSSSDLPAVDKFYIRQDEAISTPFMDLDELRIGIHWADVTPFASPITFYPAKNATDVNENVSPTITYIYPVRKIGGAPLTDSDLASILSFKAGGASGTDVPYTAVISEDKKVITVDPVNKLSVGTQFYLSVAQVEDESGNAFSSDYATFTTRPAKNDASLTALSYNNIPVTGFTSTQLTYNVVLDWGTTTVPTMTYVLSDQNAAATVTSASSLPGTCSVLVTAEDGSTTSTYSVNFTVSPVKSSDASLKEIRINGELLSGFSPTVYEYQVALPFGTATPAVISAVANSAVATVTYNQPGSTTSIGGITVKAQDGTEKQYAIFFSINPYIYTIGWKETTLASLPGWTTSNTIISSNFGTEPITNHGEFEGAYAFRFICGKVSTGSESGWLSTAMYPKSGVLKFWLYVQLPDGNEVLTISKHVKGAKDTVVVATLRAADMQSANWKQFTFEINETDSTRILFNSSLTTDGSTRIWIDDVSLRGMTSTGIRDISSDKDMMILWPNPVKEVLNVRILESEFKNLEVFDVHGVKVYETELENDELQIDVSAFRSGIYILRLRGTVAVTSKRFVRL